jgi:hypothetical protein
MRDKNEAYRKNIDKRGNVPSSISVSDKILIKYKII